MDIDAKRRELRALMIDHAEEFLLSVDESAFAFPKNVCRMRYINMDKLFQDKVAFQNVLDVLAWNVRRIQFDSIVTGNQRATTLAHRMIGEFGEEARHIIQIYNLNTSVPGSVAPLMLRNRRCLIVADVIVTGQIVQRIVRDLCTIGATPVAVLTAIAASSAVRSSTVMGHIPIYAATHIELDRLASSPESLYSSVVDLPKADPVITDVDSEFLRYFARHPEQLYSITSRQFEKLVARILQDLGFDVELTKATRDGGSDIIAHIRNSLCSFLLLVECKKYAARCKVGVNVVRSVLGVQEIVGASKSIIITTSYFTKDAAKTARQLEHRMELKDYADLKAWLARYA